MHGSRWKGALLVAGLALGGCSSATGAQPVSQEEAAALMKCDGPQPVIQEVRWLGTVEKPGAKPVPAPLHGIPAEMEKPVTLEEGVSVNVHAVGYTPVAEDRNMAMARLTVTRGKESTDIGLGRQLPGAAVCYKRALGMWVGLVDVGPRKAMVRIGLPPPEPPPEEKSGKKK
jgi:hypothetical protein